MSSIKQEIYRSSVMRLAYSIDLKCSQLAEAMNQEIKLAQPYTGIGVDESDPRTWKYYLNKAGEYHVSDEPMSITSLDTMEIIPFTKETLFKHRATVKEYKIGSQYYKDLVARYPKQTALIRGIISPIDIDKAIAAEDYTILTYDKAEVEPQELNLIPELQKWLYRFSDRWIVRDFKLTDQLYHPLAYCKIRMMIPGCIMAVRKRNCKTYQAHSFHVWNYLDSHGDLAKYQDFLTLPQTMWLYRNIEWVFHNAGKKETHEALVEALLTERSIPLGAYTVRHNNAALNEDFKPTIEAVRRPLNMHDLVADLETVRPLRYLMEKELPLALNNDLYLDEDYIRAKLELQNTRMAELPTKVYESEWIDSDSGDLFPIEQVLLDHWINMSVTNRYTSVINVRNPYTNEVMTMTVRDAFVLWMYCVCRYNGVILDHVPTARVNMVYRTPPPKFTQLRKITNPEVISDGMIDWFLDHQPIVGAVISTEAFNDMCHDIKKHMLIHRNFWACQSELHVRGQLETMCRHAYFSTTHKFYDVPKPYSEWFHERGWYIADLNEADNDILLQDIFNLALGIDLTNVKSPKEIQGAMLRLMKQLGTYDTHYIQTINENSATLLDRQPVRIAEPLIHTSHHLRWHVLENPLINLRSTHHLNIYLNREIPISAMVESNVLAKLDRSITHFNGTKGHANVRILRKPARVYMPWSSNLDDIIFEGDMGDIIIKPIEATDLAKLLGVSDLDGLYYDDGLHEIIGQPLLNGLFYNKE